MNKLEALKNELEGSVQWLDDRLAIGDWSNSMVAYFMTRRRALKQIINRIEELEKL